ncbi:MAG: phospholipase D family protein [Candidatus Omnitrophota bacterium]
MFNRTFLFLFLLLLFSSCSYRAGSVINPSLDFNSLHIYEDLSYPTTPTGKILDSARSAGTNYITMLNNGDDALLARIHLIRLAKKSIFLQTFILKFDESGRFVVNELIEAAKRGVKVKIIADYLTTTKDLGMVAYLTKAHPNLEIKLYNPVSNNITPSKFALIKKLSFDFRNFNQRMHNKVLVVDDFMSITGGRNYANDYFDRGTERNFKDRDVLVIGPAVKKMTDSFSEYWHYPLSVSSADMFDVQRLIGNEPANKNSQGLNTGFGELFKELINCESDEGCIEERLIRGGAMVDNVEFIADSPGKRGKIGQHKLTRSPYELARFLHQAQESIVMQTPYLVIGKKESKFFKKLAKDNPCMEFFVSSNSLAAADHIHAYAFSYKNKKKYLKKFRWQIFELKPQPKDNDLIVSPVNKEDRDKNYFTCIHAKTYVVDRKKVWVGSFNLDPRSANLNTEVGLIVDDERIAQAVEADIRRDMANQNSWTIGKRKEIPVISHFSGLLGNIVRAIPVFDLWPFTYSGSFELKDGKEKLPFFHEDFYENYNYVGPFPGVHLTEKEIKARLIKAFFGPVEPLI